MNEYDGVEGFIPELKATVRECVDCGALIAGGPTRCVRCAKEGAPSNNACSGLAMVWLHISVAVGFVVGAITMYLIIASR